jgi:hypothetical protein
MHKKRWAKKPDVEAALSGKRVKLPEWGKLGL